jgi:hypothetical protein
VIVIPTPTHADFDADVFRSAFFGAGRVRRSAMPSRKKNSALAHTSVKAGVCTLRECSRSPNCQLLQEESERTSSGGALQNGMVYVNSGYPRFGGAVGNVLLALRSGRFQERMSAGKSAGAGLLHVGS